MLSRLPTGSSARSSCRRHRCGVLARVRGDAPVAHGSDPHLLAGLNVHEGKITYAAVAEALGVKYVEASRAIGK